MTELHDGEQPGRLLRDLCHVMRYTQSMVAEF